MRIRESAYIALACLFISIGQSSAQSDAYGVSNGQDAKYLGLNTSPPGQWRIHFLSQPKSQLVSLQAGKKAIFSSFTECEVYDFASGSWDTHQFSVPRRNAASVSAGCMAFFAGGSKGPKQAQEFLNQVDVYNADNNTWHASRLSEAREVGGVAAYGNVAIFAGGITTKGYSARADILNTHKGRSYYNLCEPRSKLAAGAAGNKIVFAGGVTGNSNQPTSSSAIDIYEVHSRSWSTARLSTGRCHMTVASIGNRIIFAGGLITSGGNAKPSKMVDVYDAVRNNWSTIKLSEAKYDMSVAVAGNKVYFVGGIKARNMLSDRIEIYDLETDTWTVCTLPLRRQGMAIAVTASRLMFAGGFACSSNTPTNRIEVLNIETGKWSVEYLSKARTNVSSASFGGKAIFAGGTEHSGTIASAVIDTWQETNNIRSVLYNAGADIIHQSSQKPPYEWVYNDPQNDNIIVADLWKYETRTVNISILNGLRQPVITKSVIPFGDTKEPIDISGLTKGQYWVLIECSGCRPVLKQVNVKGDDLDTQTSTILAMSPPGNPDAVY
ncbi:MAG: type sorting protein [Flavipsychrobacter sp.]|jgi:hypothetical protein|nr:type sorting protein [Flavipsychrobacter sp.]